MTMDVEQSLRRSVELATGAPAYFDAPADFPRRFSTVCLAGDSGRERGCLKKALLSVKCWGGSRRDAKALHDAAEDAVESFADEADVTSCRIESTFRDADPDTGWVRYQMTVSVEYMQ